MVKGLCSAGQPIVNIVSSQTQSFKAHVDEEKLKSCFLIQCIAPDSILFVHIALPQMDG